jgi:acyl carrier protein
MDKQKVIEIIAETLNIDKSTILPTTNLQKDLCVDSLDNVELALAFESELEIEIPDEDIAKIETVQDIINYINTH